MGGRATSTRNYSMRHRAPEFKNPFFTAEREIRLVANTSAHGSSLDKSQYNSALMHGLPGEIDFKERDGKAIPFVKWTLPPGAITAVMVGPRFGIEFEQDALQLFLTKYDIHAPLTRSRGSYRG